MKTTTHRARFQTRTWLVWCLLAGFCPAALPACSQVSGYPDMGGITTDQNPGSADARAMPWLDTLAPADAALPFPEWWSPSEVWGEGLQVDLSLPAGSGTHGWGGDFPGSSTRTVSIAALGDVDYYVHACSDYDPLTASPLLLAFHGATLPGSAGQSAATVRDHWAQIADQYGFIVAAQPGDNQTGGWIMDPALALLNVMLADLFSSYNVDTSRIYLWGFSAGGHLVHALGLNNANFFAAYSVASGVLGALAGESAPAAAARRIPLDIHIGILDPNYPFVAYDADLFLAAGWLLGQDLYYTEFYEGHTYAVPHLEAAWVNMAGHFLPVE